MGVVADLIPFTKEILRQRTHRGLLKVYLLGSMLVLLGVVGGLVETVLLPFLEGKPQNSEEDSEPEFLFMKTMMDDTEQSPCSRRRQSTAIGDLSRGDRGPLPA